MIAPGDWLRRRALLSPDRVALVEAKTGATTTYRAWNDRANQVARWLARQGIGRGDRVAVLAKNRAGYLDLLFACAKLGAVLQTLNVRLTAAELAGILGAAPPSLLIHDAALAAVARAIRAERGSIAAGFASFDEPAADELGLAASANEAAEPVPVVELTASDPWVICYTGGSTGLPKGAILTHGSILANAVNTVTSWGLGPSDVAILNAPLFHVGGISVLTTPLVLGGGTSIVCDGFDAGEVLDLCARGGVTTFFGVPTMFLAILEHPRFATTDLSRLRLVISGGAPCPPPIFEAMAARGVPFKQGYGLTEAGPNNFWLPDDQVAAKPGRVGYPLFQIDARVVDERGATQPAGTPGELWLRGPHVFGGYFGQPSETAKVLVDGWLRTGDVAVVDDDGAFSIVGRIKDILISGGENVYPAEVEGAIALHPAVAEVALIGAPDPKWGEIGVAIVVLRGDCSDDDLALFCRDRLARYKVPKRWERVAALPRNGAGKVDKIALRARYGA